MGQFISQLIKNLFAEKEARILMVGLDAAGKTSILYKIKLDENVATIPTIGFNVETIKYKRMTFIVWDVGGQDKIRPLWKHYYHGCDAVIFVVDSADLERIPEATDELHRMMSDEEMRNVVLLVFANKQDLPDALNATGITQKMALHSLANKNWFVQPCCALSGEGLYEGLDWLVSQLKST